MSSRIADAASKPVAETSAKGRDKLVLTNLTVVTSRTVLLGLSSSDILLADSKQF
jgi:hypothetical protein